jgi:hypothetical protein
MANVITDNMIVGLPESTFYIVFSSFAFFALLLLVWALSFRSDSDVE